MREVDIDAAVAVLRSGGLVAFPTETVYGLGADATNEAAVAAVFQAKQRPHDHPLILHLADVSELPRWAAEIPPAARRLADVLWPGPLTLVLRRSAEVPLAVTGGRDTVALRVPAHPVARALIAGLGRPVAGPSANRFGKVSPTTADHVRADLFDLDVALLDGGPASVGIESTIVDVSSGAPVILRSGGIGPEVIEAVLGAPVALHAGLEVRAPGMHPSHYAPRARVVALQPSAIEAFVASSAPPYALLATTAPSLPEGARHVMLPADMASRARDLYATLRELDATGVPLIAVELPPPVGLGVAIADRLTRAAAPRP